MATQPKFSHSLTLDERNEKRLTSLMNSGWTIHQIFKVGLEETEKENSNEKKSIQ